MATGDARTTGSAAEVGVAHCAGRRDAGIRRDLPGAVGAAAPHREVDAVPGRQPAGSCRRSATAPAVKPSVAGARDARDHRMPRERPLGRIGGRRARAPLLRQHHRRGIEADAVVREAREERRADPALGRHRGERALRRDDRAPRVAGGMRGARRRRDDDKARIRWRIPVACRPWLPRSSLGSGAILPLPIRCGAACHVSSRRSRWPLPRSLRCRRGPRRRLRRPSPPRRALVDVTSGQTIARSAPTSAAIPHRSPS